MIFHTEGDTLYGSRRGKARPFIQDAPEEWIYGSVIAIHTPQAAEIKWGRT